MCETAKKWQTRAKRMFARLLTSNVYCLLPSTAGLSTSIPQNKDTGSVHQFISAERAPGRQRALPRMLKWQSFICTLQQRNLFSYSINFNETQPISKLLGIRLYIMSKACLLAKTVAWGTPMYWEFGIFGARENQRWLHGAAVEQVAVLLELSVQVCVCS